MRFPCVPQESGNVFKTQRSFTSDVLRACVFMYCCIFIICVYVYVIFSVCKKKKKKKEKYFHWNLYFFVALLLPVHIQIFKNDGTSQNLCFSTEWYQCNTRFMLTAGFNLHTEDQSYKLIFNLLHLTRMTVFCIWQTVQSQWILTGFVKEWDTTLIR